MHWSMHLKDLNSEYQKTYQKKQNKKCPHLVLDILGRLWKKPLELIARYRREPLPYLTGKNLLKTDLLNEKSIYFLLNI